MSIFATEIVDEEWGNYFELTGAGYGVLVVVMILGILMVTKIGNPLAAFVGVMGLKVSAYAQPMFSKLTSRTKKTE